MRSSDWSSDVCSSELRRHGDKEDRLLKLDAPADRHAACLEHDQETGQQQKREEDAGGRGDKDQPHRAARTPATPHAVEQRERSVERPVGTEVVHQRRYRRSTSLSKKEKTLTQIPIQQH